MRIIYLHQYYCTPSMNGGIRSYEFAKRLAKAGHDVIVVTSDTENKFKGWKVEKQEGFEVHWISVSYNNNYGFCMRLYAFFKFLILSSVHICRMKSDKLYATSTPLTIAIPALIYKLFKKKPFIFEVRDVWPEVPVALGVINNRALIKLSSILEKQAYSNAEHIVALSPDMEKSISNEKIKGKISVIPNASDCHLFNLPLSENDPFISKLKVIRRRHKKVVFYTGALGVVNNLQSFIKLASFSNGEVAFVVIGKGRQESDLRKFAGKLGITDKVVYFMPNVNKKQLSAVHSIFDMAASTVLPIKALYANSANKVFDAFAAGTPLLINHGGWIKDLIEKTYCGLVINNDPTESDYIALKEFLFNDYKYKNACKASLNLGLNEFNRDNLFKKLNSLFKVGVS